MKKQVLTALALATAVTATTAQAEDVQIGGKVFFDYAKHASTGNPDETAGNISRTYLTAKKKINDTWSAKVTFDSAYDGTIKKNNNVFLKKAQLTGKFSDLFQVKLGMIGTPWIGYADKLNKHRFIAKSYTDTHKMASSADAGIGVFGKNDMFSYDVVSINGGGYGNTGKTEKTDIELRAGTTPVKGLTVDLGYRSGYLGKFAAGTAENKNTLTQFMVTYGAKGDLSYRVGFNAISNKVDDELLNTSKTIKGTELWAWVRSGDFGGYFRNETTDYDIAGSDKENRNVISLDYHADKNVIISLVFDKTTAIGGSTTTNEKSTTGLFTQFKF